MADVPGKFFSATKVRTGVAPSSSGSIVGEPLPPVNPPGSSLNSVGLTMPSAFSVSNSPLTANGTIGVAGAGTVGQYIRGDGSLADFPESSGGGSSVSYYLNGSISQGTIGGVAYKELNKVPILGAGTDFTINADGYIASFITDAGDPNLLEIPGGNWNFETYFSASSSGGTPTFYVELYKYDGTTFTLIASSSSSPELIAFGTTLTPYFSTLAVPTTTLALTDRLAVRYYVTHSGRTITMHTENNHLCQIITTFTTGLTALNGLTAQVQNFAVGTSGTDFNIASATATHTFNLPTASATNRGALSSADWSLFTQAYNDKINSAAVTGTTTKTLTLTQQDGGTITASWSDLNTDAVTSVFGRTGAVVAANGDYTTAQVTESGNLYYTEARVSANTDVAANTAARHNAVTLGTANGLSLSTQQLSLALASGSTTGALSSTDWNTFNSKQPAGNYVTTDTAQTISGEKTFTNSIILKNSSTGLVLSSFYADRLQIGGLTYSSEFIFPATSRFWNLPDATGTIALVGGAGVGTVTSVAALTLGTTGTDLSSTVANSTTTPVITLNVPTASATNRGALSAADWTTFNNKQNALTNPVTGTGASGQVAYFNGTTSITSESNLFWDATNDRLGIGTAIPTDKLQMNGGKAIFATSNFNGTTAGGSVFVFSDDNNGGKIWAQKDGNQSWGYLSLQPLGGNVLIGTTSDNGAKFQVSTSNLFLASLIGSGGESILRLQNTAINGRNWYIIAGGNIGAFSNGEFGIYDATSSTPRLTITSTGAATFSSSVTANVVISRRDATTSGTDAQFISENRTGTSGQYAIYGSRLDNGSGAGFVPVAFGAIQTSGAGRTGDFIIAVSNTDNVNLSTHERMRITSGGNVWVGNDSNPLLEIANGGSTDVLSGIRWSIGSSRVDYGGIYSATSSANNNYISFYTKNSASAPSERMRIFSGGNVRIGGSSVTDNGNKLRVDGNIWVDAATSGKVSIVNSSGVSTTIGVGATTGYVGTNSDHQLDLFTNNVVLATLKTDGEFQFVKISTNSPSGGTAAIWKLGKAATVSPTSPNRTIEVEVGGTTYYLHAKTTNN